MMVRKDVFAEWGWPGRVSDEGQVRLRLEDIMMDAADDRLRGLWLKRSDGEVRWNGRQDQEFRDDERPVVCGNGPLHADAMHVVVEHP